MSAPETLAPPAREAPGSGRIGARPARGPLFLRDRNIALLWAGQLCSQVGTRMYQLALAWWILSQGGGGREVGLFLVAGALPGLLLMKASGRAVDGSRGSRLLVASDLAAVAVVSAVGLALWAGALSPWGLYLAGFALAATQAFFDPGLNKAVGELARPEDVEEAVALQSSTQSIASVAGAAAGALLIDALGIGGVVALNAASFLVSAATCALLRWPGDCPPGDCPPGDCPHRFIGRPEEAPPAEPSGWSILEGRPWIKKVLIGFGFVNFFLSPVLVVLPVYVKETLSGSASLLGVLEGCLWLGLVCGTFAAGRMRVGPNKAAVGAACLAITAPALAAPGLLADARLLGAMLFVAGLALGVNNVKFVALFQELVPGEVKGRFFAVMQALLSFSYPAAFFLFGQLADRLGPPATMLVQGAGVLALAGYFAVLARSGEQPRLSPESSPGPKPGTPA